MFEPVKRALGIGNDRGLTDEGHDRYGDEPEREDQEPERLVEERARLGETVDPSMTTLSQKREEMIREQRRAEQRARRDDRPDINAPNPADDDRSRREILTKRMELDLGERENRQTTDRYDSISLRDEYWWHPAFSQSERARARRDGPDPIVQDADPDGDRMVSHTDADWSVVWDDPDGERGGVVETADWERREQRRERGPERNRDRDRDHDDARETRAPEQEQDRDDRDRPQPIGWDMETSPLSDETRDLELNPDVELDHKETSDSVAPDRDEIDVERDRDRDRDRGRGR
jgi:hypothetical protein